MCEEVKDNANHINNLKNFSGHSFPRSSMSISQLKLNLRRPRKPEYKYFLQL